MRQDEDEIILHVGLRFNMTLPVDARADMRSIFLVIAACFAIIARADDIDVMNDCAIITGRA